MISIRVFFFFKKLLDRLAERYGYIYDVVDEPKNLSNDMVKRVYPPEKLEIYDWEREQSKLRHPSNYKRTTDGSI